MKIKAPGQPIDWKAEMEKCVKSPYYFATNYLTIKNEKRETLPFTTFLTEEEFNNYFKPNENEFKDSKIRKGSLE